MLVEKGHGDRILGSYHATKKEANRRQAYLETHLAFVPALFNLLLALNRLLEPDAVLEDRLLHIAQYSL